MPSNYLTDDTFFGKIDLDEQFITDAWLVDQFVGSSLVSWGSGNLSQLGNGATASYNSPLQISSLTNWKQISCGYAHTVAVKTDGTLWSWGRNTFGELCSNDVSNSATPTQRGTLTNWKQAKAGLYHTLAVKTDGTLWSCGLNNQGQLGNNTVNIYYSSPIQVGSLTNWNVVDASNYNSAAIKQDGTLWVWGDNSRGQLGNNLLAAFTDYSSPIQVGSLTNWKSVSCGYSHVIAIKTDGTLWAWGENDTGQLGNGTSINYSSPVQIGTLTDWKQSYSGRKLTSAIKIDGSLWVWGLNQYGSLGNGTTINYSSPIQVGSLTNWKQVSCYEYNVAATKTDGTMWIWGYGAGNEIPGGFTVSYSSPIQVGYYTNWKHISCGGHFSVASTFKDLG